MLCWAMASPYLEVQEQLQTCTSCFHTSRPMSPHPEFCYELSMVCALMACYVPEAVGASSSGPGRVVGEIAQDQAD
jgi:hypothetical protein